MTRYVALIRHGAYAQAEATPSALQPWPLTEAGQAQARACGAELADLLDRFGLTLDPVAHCSEQLRAWQTGTLALDALAQRQTPALSERSVGSFANLTVTQIEQALTDDPRFDAPPPGWKSNSDYRLPLEGAESLMMAGERVAGHLRRIAERPSTAPTLSLCFGHGASFRHAAHHLGLLTRARIAEISMHHAKPLLFCYGPQGRWAHVSGAWKERGRTTRDLD